MVDLPAGLAQGSSSRDLTDAGNAERLADRHRHEIRYCDKWAKWLIWDGRRWAVDETRRIDLLATETVQAIKEEALAVDDHKLHDRLLKWSLASQRGSHLRALVDWARSRDGIPVRPQELDRDPYVLNLENGTFDLNRMRLRDHDADDLITKLAPVAYDPDATAPRWTSFVREIFDGDDDLATFAQRAAGYSLTGDTSAQVFFLLHGDGANGKSTFVETLQSLLGDYALETPTDTLLVRRYSGIPNDVARLQAARFVAASEIPKGAKLNEPLVKQLVAGDTVSARFMRSEFFDFRPVLKLWIDTNYRPTVHGTDEGIWRRVRVLPFTRTFPPGQRDESLRDKLAAELPGILNWALDGWRDYSYGDTLEPPRAVIEATEEYRQEQDVIAMFLDDCAIVDPAAAVAPRDLYAAYTAWCHANGERPDSQKALGTQLKQLGYEPGKSNGVRLWKGLKLTDDHHLFADDPGPAGTR